MNETPAGWYPANDGSENLRYWDGNAWTEQVATPAPVGGPMSTTAAPVVHRPPPFAKGCGVFLALGIAAAVAVAIFASVIDGTDTGKRLNAENACQNAVADKLKAPSTAKFTTGETTGEYPSYTTSGYVDAQNGFGAQIRSNYVCDIVGSDDGDAWTPSSVIVAPR